MTIKIIDQFDEIKTYEIQGWFYRDSQPTLYEGKYYAEDIYHDGRINILKLVKFENGTPKYELVEEDVFEA